MRTATGPAKRQPENGARAQAGCAGFLPPFDSNGIEFETGPLDREAIGARVSAMKHFLQCAVAIVTTFLATGCSGAETSAPTKEIVETTLRRLWDKPASSFSPKTALELHSVKFGKAYKATAQEVQVDGVPDGARVTPAIVDFSVRTFNSNATQVVRRVREAKVYRDKFDEWAVMTGSVRGQDSNTSEPAVKKSDK